MNYTTRSPSLQRLERHEARWIVYKLQLQGIRQVDVARVSGMAASTVSGVLTCERSSARVYAALCKLLGYESISMLLADAQHSDA